MATFRGGTNPGNHQRSPRLAPFSSNPWSEEPGRSLALSKSPRYVGCGVAALAADAERTGGISDPSRRVSWPRPTDSPKSTARVRTCGARKTEASSAEPTGRPAATRRRCRQSGSKDSGTRDAGNIRQRAGCGPRGDTERRAACPDRAAAAHRDTPGPAAARPRWPQSPAPPRCARRPAQSALHSRAGAATRALRAGGSRERSLRPSDRPRRSILMCALRPGQGREHKYPSSTAEVQHFCGGFAIEQTAPRPSVTLA